MATRAQLATAKAARERKRAKPASRRSDYQHAYRLKTVYGITAEEYADLLAKQGGRCAICGNRPRKWRLAVEHSHFTNTIRGLVCMQCNRNFLGALERNAENVAEAIDRALEYLTGVKDDYLRYKDEPAATPTLRPMPNSLVAARRARDIVLSLPNRPDETE